jgi:hypothetical protein
MSIEPTQPTQADLAPDRDADPGSGSESEQSPPTRLDPQWQETPATRLEPQLQPSPETRLEPQLQPSPETRVEPQLQETPATRLEPQLQPSPETRQEPQWRPNPKPQPAPAWRPNPQPQQDSPPQDSPPQQAPQWQQPPQQAWQQPPQQAPQWQQDRQPAPRWQQEQDGYQDAAPPPRRRRRHRVRRSVIALFIIIVLAILLVIANFVGKAVAENDMADQFTANGFPVRPNVNIEGFPFLTQVVAKDFRKVVVTASNVPAGPVTISSLNATIIGMHLNSSWNGATIDRLTATAFIPLGSLTGGISNELGDAASLTAVPDGPDRLKITGSVFGEKASAVVEIKQTGPQQITVELPTTGGLVGTLLGSAASFPINLPAGVPPSLRITGLTLNGTGLTVSAAATNATFSK